MVEAKDIYLYSAATEAKDVILRYHGQSTITTKTITYSEDVLFKKLNIMIPRPNLVADIAYLSINTPCAKSILRTSDGTVHILVQNTTTGCLYIYHSHDEGQSWNSDLIWDWLTKSASFDKDSNDNLYVSFICGPNASTQIGFKKLTVNKTGSPWTWTVGSFKQVYAPWDTYHLDIIVDGNNYLHIVADSALHNWSYWCRSVDGGANWTEADIGWNINTCPSIIKDSSNNLYVIFGMWSGEYLKMQKIAYNGGQSWTVGSIVQITFGDDLPASIHILPDDRIIIVYGIWDVSPSANQLAFRKATNPQDITVWNDEIIIATASELSDTNAYGNILVVDSNKLLVFFHGQDNKLYCRESQDSGVTFGTKSVVFSSLNDTNEINIAKQSFDFVFRVGTSQIYHGKYPLAPTIDVLFKKLDITKLYLADLILKRLNMEVPYDIDILLKKSGITNIYLLDILFKKLGLIQDYVIDALIAKLGITKDTSIDVILKKLEIPLTYDIDTVFTRLGIPLSVIVDTIIKKENIPMVYSIDMLEKKFGITKLSSIDFLLKKLNIPITYSIDAVLKELNIPISYVINVLFSAVVTTTFNIDVVLYKQIPAKEVHYLLDIILVAAVFALGGGHPEEVILVPEVTIKYVDHNYAFLAVEFKILSLSQEEGQSIKGCAIQSFEIENEINVIELPIIGESQKNVSMKLSNSLIEKKISIVTKSLTLVYEYKWSCSVSELQLISSENNINFNVSSYEIITYEKIEFTYYSLNATPEVELYVNTSALDVVIDSSHQTLTSQLSTKDKTRRHKELLDLLDSLDEMD